MSSNPFGIGPSLGLWPWLPQEQLASAVLPGGALPGADAFAGDAVLIESGLAAQNLLAINAATTSASQTSNALSTANDAIGVIGGLLGNIQAVLSAAGPGADPTFDPATEQSRIDTAVSTIDDIASSTQFGGQALLDGTFNVQDTQGSVHIPSFQSQTLGAVSSAGSSTPPQALSSLASGGPNDLSSGNLSAAGQIVSTAISQVNSAQDQINQYQSSPLQADLSIALPPPIAGQFSLADAMNLAAAQMLSDPLLTVAALANSSPQNVLPLLMP